MKTNLKKKNKLKCICLVCDFFYPKLGGVEVHVYQLSVSLIRMGYKVIILTHHHQNRKGIKYMGNGVKVYFIPHLILHDDTIFPTIHGLHLLIRNIILTEQVDLVHIHQSTSVLGLHTSFHARTMGKYIVYTDHSLFGFDDLTCVNINKVIKAYLTDADQTISVSNIGRDNLILRAYLHPSKCNVIPNAVDFTKFTPGKEEKPKDVINIVTISRQTYRKGSDLLIEVIPEICHLFPNVKFLIGGDGNKKILLDNMVKSFGLEDRVILYGSLPHHKVRDVMIQGHIYLNTSLTEAFCIAILEAASSGLFVVATDVGGVAEVLPENMIRLVQAEKDSIIKGLKSAIESYETVRHETVDYHDKLKNTYNWNKVAKKTVEVYNKAMENTDRSIINRLKRCLSVGRGSGVFYLILVVIDYLLLLFFTTIYPKSKYKICKNFEYDKYVEILKLKNNKN